MAENINRALDVDSHALRIVHRISELGSITAAARSLGYSQPAVSQHLKRLEARLGLPLVAKSGRGVRLTEAGRILARHAATVTQALDAAAGELSDLAGLRSGRVTLAAFPSASATVIPTLLRGLSTRHPGVQLNYVEAEPPEAVRAVRDRTADLAITFSYTGDQADPHRQSAQGLTVVPLWRDEMLVVAPREHRSGFSPSISYETDNVVAVFGMVAAGLGVALVPALAIAASPLPPGIVARPTIGGDVRTIHLVGTDGAETVPAVAATIRAIAEIDAAPWSLRVAGHPHAPVVARPR
jgi:molybdate transport repressor ModE-like protein